MKNLVFIILLFNTFCFSQQSDKNIINVGKLKLSSNEKVDYLEKIQSILDTIVTKEKETILYFPKGQYNISGNIIIKTSNLKILGDEGTFFEFTPQNSVPLKQGYSEYKRGIIINPDLENVTIENIHIKGYTDSSLVAYAINFRDRTSKITVRSCILEGFTGGILYNLSNEDILCENNIFRNMIFVPAVKAGGYGIVLQSSKNSVIRNNIFENSVYRHAVYYARNQFHLDNDGEQHFFYKNKVYGSEQENYITGYELAFKILGNSKVSVFENEFIGGVGHIWLVENPKGVNKIPNDIKIYNNIFTNLKNNSKSKVYAIGVDGDSTIENVKIYDNKFENNYVDQLIKFQKGKNLIVSNNKITNLKEGHFLYVDYGVENLKIFNNKVDMDNEFDGIYIGASNKDLKYKTTAEIKNNVLKSTLFGIYANNLVETTIENNIIHSMNTNIYINDGYFSGTIINNNFFGGKKTFFSNKKNNNFYFKNNYNNTKQIVE
ncbi:right-handed parallel beta-helix repeat-containing protein [Chishuiella changwenlii]|uniref:right-handed parallel beta-helix repeat-containing protein n=1 Tax=Chishuiella changwenlii TaxID=1434701 RepID=UPI002FD8DA90